MKHKLITSAGLLLVYTALVAVSPFAQTNNLVASACDAAIKAPDYSMPEWPEKTKVRVYVIGDFKPEEVAAILTPLNNWSAVSEASSSQVTFEYLGVAAEPQDCLNCLSIMRGKVFDKRKLHAAELQATVIQGEHTILHARIVIDPIIPNLTALTNAVAHELGHNFGLPDCFNCHGRNTVMNLIRTSNALNGPTSCDVAQVRRVYEHVRLEVAAAKKRQPAQVAAKILPVDDGEEPVDDDTPVVLKKP
ncbi:MAG: hypothetical protein ABJB61_10990 [bacterium]